MRILAFIEARGRASAQAMRVGNCSAGHIWLDLMLQAASARRPICVPLLRSWINDMLQAASARFQNAHNGLEPSPCVVCAVHQSP